MIKLHPYQMRGFEKLLARPDKRLATAWEMSGGKSYVELAWLQELRPERYLMVVPAAVRPVWENLIRTHFPDRDLGIILRGREAQPLSAKEAARRTDAYRAPWQLVSYDLAGEVSVMGWNRIMADEGQNLRAPNSQQSKNVRTLFRANPAASGTILSGTFIPNEVRQLWNPLDTLFAGWYGPLVKRGTASYESWEFLDEFCLKETTQYGTRHFGSRSEKLDKLKQAVDPYIDRVVQSDFAEFLPPLFVDPYPTSESLDRVVTEWSANVDSQVTHWGVFTHLRGTALAIGRKLSRPGSVVVIITGADSPEKRDELLRTAAGAERAIVVGTIDSLSVGISLSFLKAALVVEWTSAVDHILQFIARFARQDAKAIAPTRVSLVMRPDDVSRMDTVRARIDAMNTVFKAGRSETLAATVFADRPLSDAEFQQELDKIVAGVEKRAAFKGLIEAEEIDDSDE